MRRDGVNVFFLMLAALVAVILIVYIVRALL